MRWLKLRPALAAGATLLAGVSAGALTAGALAAGPHSHELTRVRHANAIGCRVSLFAEPHTVTVGDNAQLFGALRCPANGASAVSQVVTIYQHTAGAGGFKPVATATTGPGGFYSQVVPSLSANSTFYVVVAGVRSPTRAVKAEPLVTLEGPRAAALITGRHNRTTFTGTVTPSQTGTVVVLQREEATASEEWKPIGLGVVKAGGRFAISHTFLLPGAVEIRVVVRPLNRRTTLRGISNSIPYIITQRQNPLLTLESSADPVQANTAITLHGALHDGAGQKLTLWSHGLGGSFTKVAETLAGPGGAYSFPQAALHNTLYRVTGGGVSSAILFEGAWYIVTAHESPAKVQAGQPFVFSGTVSPALVGKVVYLERQNRFGHGYHIADVGVVGEGGAYSITHYVFGAGTTAFRVHVPADGINLGTSSEPFAVEVTPAPPGSLRPVPQPKLPSEGKL